MSIPRVLTAPLILGGGVVGPALACALCMLLADIASRLGPVVLVDPSSAPAFRHSVALSKPSADALARSGVWPFVSSHAVQQMEIWDTCGGRIRFDAKQCGLERLCSIAGLDSLRGALEKRMAELPIEIIRAEAKVLSPGEHSALARVSVANSELHAPLVVAADGTLSRTRRDVGIKLKTYSERRSAFCCHVRASVGSTAFQRFLPTGAIAVLPTSDESANVIWYLPEKHAELLANVPPEFHPLLLNAALEAKPSELSRVFYLLFAKSTTTDIFDQITKFLAWRKSRRSVDVDVPFISAIASFKVAKFHTTHAESYFTNRVVLVGDAAHSAHPVAGQGLNMGFGDISALSEMLVDASTVGKDFGCHDLLSNYENARFGKNMARIAACDGIHSIFCSKSKNTQKWASMCMNIANMPAIKVVAALMANEMDLKASAVDSLRTQSCGN